MARREKPDLVKRLKAIIPVGESKPLPELARRLRVSMETIADEVSGTYDGLDLLVGIRTGGGYGELPRRDWSVEHYQP